LTHSTTTAQQKAHSGTHWQMCPAVYHGATKMDSRSFAGAVSAPEAGRWESREVGTASAQMCARRAVPLPLRWQPPSQIYCTVSRPDVLVNGDLSNSSSAGERPAGPVHPS
jgi:hypothetical protein